MTFKAFDGKVYDNSNAQLRIKGKLLMNLLGRETNWLKHISREKAMDCQ